MTTALYRKSSNECTQISLTNSSFDNYSSTYFGVLTDPPFTDGTDTQDPNGDYRVLGYSKINDSGTIRNATQGEIDTFEAGEIDDNNAIDADKAKIYFQNDHIFRRAMIALIKGIIKEDNEGRLWTRDFMAAVAASTSLADFQSRVAALNTPADRVFSDAKDYILGQINKDD